MKEQMKMKQLSANGLPMATIPNTEVRTIVSQYTHEQYDIYIFLPTGYDPKKVYPALFHPDAYFTFGAVSDIVRNLQDSGIVEPFIIVGVDYGAGWGHPESHRIKDFTYKQSPQMPETGGADRYIMFIKNELLPLIQGHYSIDPERLTYDGASLGGTFGSYLMFQKDRIFKNFILSSPAFRFHENDILAIEEEYHKSNDSLPISLYTTMGTNEDKYSMLAPFFEFVGILEHRQYKDFKLYMDIGAQHIHQTNTIALLPKILMSIYPKVK